MRYAIFAFAIMLLAPTAASAKGHHGRKSRHHTSRSHGHSAKSVKRATGAVAGALTNAERPDAPAATEKEPAAHHGPQRVDFDDRLIQGQTNKSGAVYLYDRQDLQVNSMVKQPDTFRKEIAKGLFE